MNYTRFHIYTILHLYNAIFILFVIDDRYSKNLMAVAKRELPLTVLQKAVIRCFREDLMINLNMTATSKRTTTYSDISDANFNSRSNTENFLMTVAPIFFLFSFACSLSAKELRLRGSLQSIPVLPLLP